MTLPDFSQLSARGAECPSDLALDQWLAEALAPDVAAPLAAHCEGCAACSARVAERRAGFAAFEGLDERRLLANVHRRLAEPTRFGDWFTGWFKGLRLWMLPVGLAAAAALVVALRVPAEPGPTAPALTGEGAAAPPPVDGVRVKGGLSLNVHRLVAGGGSEAMLSGAAFAPGDRLRFVVDVPSAGQVRVLGVEADGDLYTAWPLDAAAATTLPAGRRQALPGAVALDDTPGDETLFVVHCPDASGPPRCETRGAGEAPACPAGCQLSPFRVRKVAAGGAP